MMNNTEQSHEFVLYKFDSCRFCQRVMRHITDLGISVTLRDTELDPDAYDTLQRVGGKTQVPCLFVDGRPLYESFDIINLLTHYKNTGTILFPGS